MGLPNLAIVAGSGALPLQLAEHCQSIGRSYKIIRFNGTQLDWASNHPVISAEFEKPKSLFSAIRKAGCKQIVFAGAIQRPKLNPLKFDLAFLKFAPTLLPALKKGDDTTLRLIASLFESEGFKIISAHQILDQLMVPKGILTRIHPSLGSQLDIERGFSILNIMAEADVGQACIVGQGLCLGIETVQGSDYLISNVGTAKGNYLEDIKGCNGVFIKAPKVGQDTRLDTPTIGPVTIQSVYDAGLSGIAIKENSVQILEKDACVKLANNLELFIVSVPDI